MRDAATHAWRSAWGCWSVVAVVVIAAMALLVGFVWLPSVQGDFNGEGFWASICRAAGVPSQWGARQAVPVRLRSTDVVLDSDMARPGSDAAIGRGATLAQQCTMCHGARGMSDADAPNLAGQYAEVIVKQLADYQHGDRSSAIMEALARNLSARDIGDLASYYFYLPRQSRSADPREAPPLVRDGDPMRNMAPCASCHGGVDHKLGAPWLEGMPKRYLSAQLDNFASGRRRNDSHAQMRNVVRQMTKSEIAEVSEFYARRGMPTGPR
jgi:cytochrome c553